MPDTVEFVLGQLVAKADQCEETWKEVQAELVQVNTKLDSLHTALDDHKATGNGDAGRNGQRRAGKAKAGGIVAAGGTGVAAVAYVIVDALARL